MEVTAYDLPVTGRILAELGGRYVRAELDTGMTSKQWGAARLAVDRPLITQLTEPTAEVDLESLFAFGLERLLDGLTIVMRPPKTRRPGT